MLLPAFSRGVAVIMASILWLLSSPGIGGNADAYAMPSLRLTAQEQVSIQQHRRICLGSDAWSAPFVMVDEDGGISG
jgi:hypothetical protein